jgi:hypothetical protein
MELVVISAIRKSLEGCERAFWLIYVVLSTATMLLSFYQSL